ncbi:hypothetical protein [Psychroserpens burtonensis]|nr:hypothetical protein [Psychroserpens burtonensis]
MKLERNIFGAILHYEAVVKNKNSVFGVGLKSIDSLLQKKN